MKLTSIVDAIIAKVNLKANLASPSLTGVPTSPTPIVGDNSTKVATTEFVLANSVNTLADLGVTSTAAELNKIDGYTGTATELNWMDTLHATGVTATEFDYLDGVTSNVQTQLNAKAPLASPTLTGTPTAPTQEVGDNSTKIATTAFVQANTGTPPDATTSVKGIVELATTVEAQAGTNDTKALTPAKLVDALQGANQSLASSGYQKLPGGLIIQWGSSTSTPIYFPISFPNACLQIVNSATRSGYSLGDTWFVNSFDESKINWYGSIFTARYFAIGY